MRFWVPMTIEMRRIIDSNKMGVRTLGRTTYGKQYKSLLFSN